MKQKENSFFVPINKIRNNILTKNEPSTNYTIKSEISENKTDTNFENKKIILDNPSVN